MNNNKTKYLIASRNTTKWNGVNEININDIFYDRVRRFEYLGTILTENDDMSLEIKARLTKGNRYYALSDVIKSKNISRNCKLNIYIKQS